MICTGGCLFLLRHVRLRNRLGIHNSHISAGNPAEIRIFREIRRRKVYTLDALFFPESALFSLALLMDLFSSAVIFLRVLVGFSASALHRGHERSLRDAYQGDDHEHDEDHIGSDRSDRCVKDHDEDAADHTAAEPARAGRLVDIEDRLPFLVSASKDQLCKSAEHDQQDLHRDHLVDRADISLI